MSVSFEDLTNAPDSDLTCGVCGRVASPRRAYYWGTCEECASVKGDHKATPLPVVGHYAAGNLAEDLTTAATSRTVARPSNEQLREALDAVHGTALAGLSVDPRGALEHIISTVAALSREEKHGA